MLGETEARTKAVSPSGVNSSSPAAQLRAPPWDSPGWKGVGWNPAPEMGGEHCKLWRHNVPMGKLWPFGAMWDGGSWAAWEPARSRAPLSMGVSAPGVVPRGQRRGNALFQ